MSTSNSNTKEEPNTTTTICRNGFVMVEHTHCVYDEADPPLVHVTLAPNDSNPRGEYTMTTGVTTTTTGSETTMPSVIRPSAPPPPDLLDTTTIRSPSLHLHHHQIQPSAPPDSLDDSNENRRSFSTTTPSVFIEQESQPPVAAAQSLPPPNFVPPSLPANNNNLQDLWKASGAAAALLGLVFGGPILAVVAGLTSIVCATQKACEETAAGDIARALGEVALAARHKWTMVNDKHHIDQQFHRALIYTWQVIKEWNRQYEIGTRIQTGLRKGYTIALDRLRRCRPDPSPSQCQAEQWLTKLGNALDYAIGYATEEYRNYCNNRENETSSTTTTATTGAARSSQRRTS